MLFTAQDFISKWKRVAAREKRTYQEHFILRTAQAEYYTAFAQGGVELPTETKVIPILYYPLMGIIILLLFGALTTLYMVLLDRLFSAYSLNAYSYGIFTGVSPLLAIGTMLLFWRPRKKG